MQVSGIRAEPGGNVTITFGPQGFEVLGVNLRNSIRMWYQRIFRSWFVVAGFSVIVVFGCLSIFAEQLGASPAVQVVIFSPGIIAAVYVAAYVLASRSMWLVEAALDWRSTGYERYPPHSVAQAWAQRSTEAVAITVQYTNGARIRYTGAGPVGQALGQGFHQLLGPRLVLV
jgi:hypothetical protein